MEQGFPDLHTAVNEPMKSKPVGNGVVHAMKHVPEIDVFVIVKAAVHRIEINPHYKSSIN